MDARGVRYGRRVEDVLEEVPDGNARHVHVCVGAGGHGGEVGGGVEADEVEFHGHLDVDEEEVWEDNG